MKTFISQSAKESRIRIQVGPNVELCSSSTPWADAIPFVAVFALAFSVRLLYLFQIEAIPLFYYLAADGRDLEKPDNRPLYAYAMETSEFENLAALLPGCHKHTRSSHPFVLGSEWLFVIYAAEWWRRKYEGGAWKWEDVFRSIDWPDLTSQQRQELTRKGLKY